jgi:chromate reductase, NAD(P)H dehydrogenase (quinone)
MPDTALTLGVIVGSLRQRSYNRALVAAAGDLLPGDTSFIEIGGIRELPAFDEDIDTSSPPDSVHALREAIGAVDGLLIATPEYNSGIPGTLQNALDWASRPFGVTQIVGKPTAVMGVSTSAFGAAWAQEHLRRVLVGCGARVMETDLPVTKAAERFDADGKLTDEETRKRLASHLAAFVAFVRNPPGDDDW